MTIAPTLPLCRPFRALAARAVVVAFAASLAAPVAQAACTAGSPDPNLAERTPTADFIDHGDGTVTHLTTGLMWQRCSQGQTWSGGTCSGGTQLMDWAAALTAPVGHSFAGNSDWRLPTVRELQSITETCGDNPAINTIVFPVSGPGAYWSASNMMASSSNAWNVLFNNGAVNSNFKSDMNSVRFVRGGQSLDSFDLLTPDTRPTAFTFTDQTSVPTSDVRTSNTITVAGINAAANISIVGGEYRIGSGGWTSTAGTVSNGETVTVRHSSSASFGATVDTTLTIDSVADTFSSTTESADTTPDAFSFTDQTNVARASLRTSNAITVAGINAAANISVSAGSEYRIGSGGWTGTAGTVNNGETVTVRHTSSAGYSSTVNTVLTIGGVSDTFSSSTEGAPPAPIDGACGSAHGQSAHDGPTSNLCASGYGSGVAYTASAYTWSCYGWNGGSTASCSAPRSYRVTPDAGSHGSLTPASAQEIAWNAIRTFTATPEAGYRVQSFTGCGGSTSGNTLTTAPVTADCTVSARFIADDTTPDPFAFPPQSGVQPNSTISSDAVRIGGINTAVPIRVSGGSYSIDGAPFTSAEGRINNGQSVRAQVRSATAWNGTATATVSIGGGSGNFTVTTHSGADPQPFAFATVRGVAPGSVVDSAEAILSGFTGSKTAYVSGGLLSVDGGAWASSAAVVSGSRVRVRVTAAAKPGGRATATVSVGTTSGRFTAICLGGGGLGGVLPLLLN